MLSQKRPFSLPLFCLAIGMLAPACQTVTALPDCEDPLGCVIIPPGEPIKIAAIQTLSGDSAVLGTEQVNTFKLRLDQRQWRLLKHPIELQVEDDLCTPEGGANAALKVVADPQVVAILGTTCSGAAATASEIMSDAGLVMISSSNTAPSLTSVNNRPGENWHPGFFRVIYNDAIAGQTAAEFAHDVLGFTTAATLNDGDLYSRQLTAAFGEAFEALGGEIVLEASPNIDTEDMSPFLEAIANANAEFIFMPMTQTPSIRMINQAKAFPPLTDTDDQNLTVLVGEELISDSFIEAVDSNGIGTYFAGPTPIQNESNQALIELYQQAYGEPPQSIYYSFAEDSLRLLLFNIVRTAEQHEDGTLVIGRQKLRDKLHDSKTFGGITGQLSCDEFGDCGVANFSILQLVDPEAGSNGLRENLVYTNDSR